MVRVFAVARTEAAIFSGSRFSGGGSDQAQHGVAQELEPLVGGQPAVLVGVAAVHEREAEQLVTQLDAERREQGLAVLHGPRLARAHPFVGHPAVRRG